MPHLLLHSAHSCIPHKWFDILAFALFGRLDMYLLTFIPIGQHPSYLNQYAMYWFYLSDFNLLTCWAISPHHISATTTCLHYHHSEAMLGMYITLSIGLGLHC